MKEIESLTNDFRNQNIAIMCREKEPHVCHRTLRIARVLETQIEAMKNLRKAYNQDTLDLFETSEDERTRLAVFAQEQKTLKIEVNQWRIQ